MWVELLTLWFGLLVGQGAVESPGPGYGVDTAHWKDIGYLMQTAEEARVEVRAPDELDLGTLDERAILALFYPQTPLPVASLLHFVDSGGALIVADDFGGSGALLEAVGLRRRLPNIAEQRQHRVGEGLYELRPEGEHFLYFHVDTIVANHPAVFEIDGEIDGDAGQVGARAVVRPILVFEGGGVLVFELAIGKGRMLLISDPSIFINEMMRTYHGNKQFAANVLRFYCKQEPCAVEVLRPETRIGGQFEPRLGLLNRGRLAFRRVVDVLAEGLARPPIPLIFALMSALLLGWIAQRAWRGDARVRPILPLRTRLQVGAAERAQAGGARVPLGPTDDHRALATALVQDALVRAQEAHFHPKDLEALSALQQELDIGRVQERPCTQADFLRMHRRLEAVFRNPRPTEESP